VKFTQPGVGTAENGAAIRNTAGTSLLPIQAKGDGNTMFRVMGRVSPEADWVELRAPAAADFLETITWVPYLRLEVVSGSGTVNLWIAER
jgi:hypothetical protein